MSCNVTDHPPIDCHLFSVCFYNEKHDDEPPCTHAFLGTSIDFISLGYNSRSPIAGSEGLCTFNFNSRCQLDFPRGYSTSYHPSNLRVIFALHPRQLEWLSVLFVLPRLSGVKCSLTVFICISLPSSGSEQFFISLVI